MIVNQVLTGSIAIIVAYLIGSIPFAYIFTRLATGQDIRRLGSGNAGANNVFREVGLRAAVPTAFFDVGKGALAVAVAHWLLYVPLREPDSFVLVAAITAIAGHIWPIYLKFSGGNGLAATIGALAILMPWELLIVIGLLLVLKVVTNNLVLSVNIALLSVPISAWFFERSWLFVGFSIVVAVLLILNFIPQAKVAYTRAGGRRNLADELLRKDKD